MMSKLQEKSARIVAIMNNKGGPGKTSSATNLAVHYARSGKRTLLIDSDQQANTTEVTANGKSTIPCMGQQFAISIIIPDLISVMSSFLRWPVKYLSLTLILFRPTRRLKKLSNRHLHAVTAKKSWADILRKSAPNTITSLLTAHWAQHRNRQCHFHCRPCACSCRRREFFAQWPGNHAGLHG